MLDKARVYANETTIHGVSDVVEAPSKSRQAVWVVMLIATAGMLGYEIYRIVDQHIKMPYGTRVETVQLAAFPVVGICPPETVDARKAVQYGLTLQTVELIHSVLPNIESAWFAWPDSAITEETRQQLAELRSKFDSYSSMLKNLSYDMLPHSTIICEHCTEIAPAVEQIVKANGVCLRIAETEIPKALGIGTKVPTLQISYWVPENQSREMGCAEEIYLSGIDVADYGAFMERCLQEAPVGDEIYETDGTNGTMSSNEVFNEPLGFRMMIGRQAEEFDNLGDIHLGLMDTRVLVNIIERRLINSKGSCLSTEEDLFVPCQLECMNSRMTRNSELDGCDMPCTFYVGEAAEKSGSNLNFCNLEDVWKLNETDPVKEECLYQLEDYCHTACPKPCNYFLYEPSVVPISTSAQKSGTMNAIVRPLHPEAMLRLVEIKTYTWDTFLSNIGGMVGLFCGASILSVAHLVSFCLCGPRGKTNVTEAKKQTRF